MGQILQKTQNEPKQELRDIERLFRRQIIQCIIDLEKKRLEPGEIEELKRRQALEEVYPFSKCKAIYTKCQTPAQNIRPQAQEIDSHMIEKDFSSQGDKKKTDGTGKWSESAQGVIVVKFNGKKHWGAGTLIGPNIVLTAGRNLYDHQEKVYAELESMQFLPGTYNGVLPFGSSKVKRYSVTCEYTESEKEDYGILILEDSIGEMTGYLGIAVIDQQEIMTKRIAVTGYSINEEKAKDSMYETHSWEGQTSGIDKDKISYSTDICQSGSGIWYKEEDRYFIVGVHAQGDNNISKGTLLTRERYQQIREWIGEAFDTRLDNSIYELGCRRFVFDESYLGAEEFSTIMKYKLSSLEGLSLRSYTMSKEASQVLFQNTTWINLSELELQGNLMGDEGAKALSQNTIWTKLSVIDLRSNNIGDEGAKALAQNTSWPSLSVLSLSLNKMGPDGIRALSQNKTWINLSMLDLSYNKIGPEGAKALAENTTWTKLSCLEVSSNSIGDEGAKALAQNKAWTSLSEIALAQNKIGPKGAKAISESTILTHLRSLNLSSNEIGNEGARFLAQNNTWTKLWWACLVCNKISDKGAKALAQNPIWTNLPNLDLKNGNRISDEVAKAFTSEKSNLSQLNSQPIKYIDDIE